MSAEDNKAVVLRFIEDVWGKGNLNIVDELIANNHVHHLTRRDVHGPDGVKQLVSGFRAFLPDVEICIEALIGEDNKVVVYFNFQGTDVGGYMGKAPSGNSVSYKGIDIFRLVDNKIIERWGMIDTVSMLYQIGAIQ